MHRHLLNGADLRWREQSDVVKRATGRWTVVRKRENGEMRVAGCSYPLTLSNCSSAPSKECCVETADEIFFFFF